MSAEKQKSSALSLFLGLSALFVTSLVTCNLIFLKFFHITIDFPTKNTQWFSLEFGQSVGLLAYPITFIVTDVISEVFGRKNANKVVVSGLFASLFMLLIVWVAIEIPVADGSPLGQDTFVKVFGLSPAAVLASMTAYLVAQFIDVRLFHFWKKLTKGKHLWLRNNFSTIFSQIIDTFLVLAILLYFEQFQTKQFLPYFYAGVLFKFAFALIDTPIIYLTLYFIRKHFGLKFGQEIAI